MSSWDTGLSTGCFYQTPILDCLESIERAGFKKIEICSLPRHLDYHDGAAVQRAASRIQDLGLEAYSLHAPFADHIDISSPDPDIRKRSQEQILQAAMSAAVLQVRYFVVHPGPETGGFPEHERLSRMEHAASVLNEAARRCHELGISLILENKLPHLFAGRVRDLLWILASLDTTEVGICLDTGHAHLAGELPTVVHTVSTNLRMVHASDNHGHYDDHLPPGDGEIRWEELLRELATIQFDGSFILEISGAASRDEILAGAERARRYLTSLVASSSE